MEGPKPQYVEVAEVLGCKPEPHTTVPGIDPILWVCACRKDEHVYPHGKELSDGWMTSSLERYDTDWSASGPFIERLEIDITKHRTGKWEATAWMPVWFRGNWKNPECVTGIGVTPLLAFCDLMIRLKREPEVLREVLKRLDS